MVKKVPKVLCHPQPSVEGMQVQEPISGMPAHKQEGFACGEESS